MQHPHFDHISFQVEAMVILFSNQSNYQIMNQKASLSDEQVEAQGRFLMRHSSSSLLSIFGCCSPEPPFDSELGQLEKTPPQKISIKSVLKKSGIYGCKNNSQISGSRFQQGGKKSQISSNSPKFLNRRISQCSQISGQTVKNRSERTLPKNKHQNINFAYSKECQDNLVHSYESNNYLLEKYIVQAEQTNINLRGQKEKKIKSAQNLASNVEGLTAKNKTEENCDNSPKWGQQVYQFQPPRFSANRSQNPQLNCHFSFGQHQKAMFMNKFGGFRQVCSNRPSKQSANIQNQQDIMSIDFADNQSKPFNFFRNKNEKLHNLVRNVQTLNEDINDLSSDKSEVIDSYQNIMSRIQDRSKITHLTRTEQL